MRSKSAETIKSAITQSGLLAQEVEKAAKEIGYNFSGVDAPKNSDDYYGLRYAEFVVPLIKAVQEQQVIIEEQNQKYEVQNDKYNELKNEIELLKSKFDDILNKK